MGKRSTSAPATVRDSTKCIQPDADVVIESCLFSPDECARAALVADGAERLRIVGNKFRLPIPEGCGRIDGVDGVDIQRSSDVSVVTNTFANGRDQVSITESTSVVIASNHFDGVCHLCIYAGSGSDVELATNSLLADALLPSAVGLGSDQAAFENEKCDKEDFFEG